jgi:protein-S-isoprenylcysteine O-methyltransferase Ste14
MNREHYILGGIWVLYGIIHSLLATKQCKSYFSGKLSENAYRIVYNVIAVMLLGAVLIFQFSIKSKIIKLTGLPVLVVGIILTFSGLAIMWVCIKKYFTQLSGIRGESGAGKLYPVLETTGLHAFVRHPLYFGTFVFGAGLFFLFPLLANLIAVLFIIIYTLIGIRWEEKKLISRFGDRYLSYKEKVPMIIPFYKL